MYALQQSTAITVPVFAFDSAGDPVTGKIDANWTKRISKASGAFASMTVTVTEKEGGWYDVVMDTGHTNTLGILTVYLTATGVKQINLQWMVTIAGAAGANVTHIDALATNANLATLNLKQLNVVNSTGDAIVASSTGSNGHGLAASGNGTGAGVRGIAGATGQGIWGTGGATSGSGLVGTATSGAGLSLVAGGNSSALSCSGAGAGAAASFSAGATGNGLRITGGATSGQGIWVSALAGDGNALLLQANGFGEGLKAEGGVNGHGIEAVGGATSGNGVLCTAGTNGHGIRVAGNGTGEGISVSGGATGHGAEFIGGATSGDGIKATATASGKALGDAAVDAILNRTMTTPTGVPAATATLASALGRVYMALRNKVTVTATAKTFHDDAGTATFKKVLADDGTTYTEDQGITP